MFLRLVIQGGDGCITSCSVEVPGEEFAVLTEWAMYYKRKKEKISKKHIFGVTTAERPPCSREQTNVSINAATRHKK